MSIENDILSGIIYCNDVIARLVKTIIMIMRKMLIHERTSLSLGSYFWQSNCNWVVDRRNMPVEDLNKSQFQNEEECTDQRSSHFKLCIALNFK